MSTTKAVHQCLFCPQVFGSAAEKDDHTLEHFAQETCTECNQKLIRIGNNLYTVHNAVTCIKRELKTGNSYTACTTADDQYLLQDECYSETNTFQSICEEEIEIKVEQDNVEDHQQSDGQANPIEVQEPESHQSVVETNHENDIQDTNNINEYFTKNLIASTPNDNPFMCTICGKTLNNRAGLLKHIRWTHDPTCTKFKCKYCKREVLSQSALDIHIVRCKRKLESQRQHQLQQSLQITNEHSLMGEMHIKIESEVIAESAASIGYNKIDSMGEGLHVNSIQELGTELHPKTSNENSLTALKEKVQKKCEICCQTFASSSSLRRHKVRKHSTLDTIFCKHCARVFSTEEALLNHRGECPIEKYQSQKRGDHVCDVCGQHFLRAFYLQNHKVRKHSTPDTMFCKVCAKVFSTADELWSHESECRLKQRKHQKTQRIRMKKNQVRFETLECYLCKEIFATRQSLRSHIKWNHVPYSNKPSNDQMCICTVCGKYIRKSGFDRHMPIHTGEKRFKCLYEGCEKPFITSSARNRHMKIHTGEKPYHCTINGCDRKFAIPFNLKHHKFKVHSISFDNQFTCPVCKKVFLANCQLRKHLETHRA